MDGGKSVPVAVVDIGRVVVFVREATDGNGSVLSAECRVGVGAGKSFMVRFGRLPACAHGGPVDCC
jgi:hypothetical protein